MQNADRPTSSSSGAKSPTAKKGKAVKKATSGKSGKAGKKGDAKKAESSALEASQSTDEVHVFALNGFFMLEISNERFFLSARVVHCNTEGIDFGDWACKFFNTDCD